MSIRTLWEMQPRSQGLHEDSHETVPDRFQLAATTPSPIGPNGLTIRPEHSVFRRYRLAGLRWPIAR